MFCVVLKDGSLKTFDHPVCGLDVAKSLSSSLLKNCVAVRVNGELWDLGRVLPSHASIEIITRNTNEGRDIIRHDTAHILAQAVKELFPDTQITIGPAIENGFYYDFARKNPFSIDDFDNIEKRMKEIVDQDIPFIREEWPRDIAIAFFKDQGELFKAELIESIPKDQVISIYKQGSFTDLCRGPHLPSTRWIGKAFKLMKIAGAYWRGDHKNPMLQRIYGTAWENEEALKTHLFQLEEAQKRDHRKIGQELDLFHLQEEAQGSIFWHPKGWTIYRILENFMRNRLEKAGYVEVKTPQIIDSSLWMASGHWDKFRESMFVLEADEKHTLGIKPMNCPCHVQIFNQGIKSYRDLPLRMAEFGSCHRNEPSGALHGIMRVRAFTQDDAHIFCTPEQVISETKDFCDLLKGIYTDLGFSDFYVKFSDRPATRAGDDHVWDKAEHALKKASKAANLNYTLNPGEGAFYGPKLEFVLRDAIGREWQCGTLQVDFVLPERLNASYVGEDGNKHRPVMLHRAILGSFERFIGILIEHYAGKFPMWLAPVQVVVMNVTDHSKDYAKKIVHTLKNHRIRAEEDLRNEKISYKIREHSLQKIPYILVVGEKEMENGTVAVRQFGENQQSIMQLDDFLKKAEDCFI